MKLDNDEATKQMQFAKLLNIASLNSIMRKLTFDFSDIKNDSYEFYNM